MLYLAYVISCILDLTNSFGKIGNGFETNSAFKLCLPSFAKCSLKTALSFPVFKKIVQLLFCPHT